MKKIYNKIIKNKRNILVFFLILTIISSLQLFKKGIIFGADCDFHLNRVEALSNNIKIGKILPVYFNYLNGFGYANGLFYPDIFLYIPAFINVIGIDLITSVKIFTILINFFCIISIYICLKNITKNPYPTIIGTILYSLSLYKFADIYLRTAIGETITFIFIPLFILGIYEIFYGENKKSYFLTIGLVGICYSHVITFYLTCFFLIVFILINIKKLKEKKILKSLILNIIISLFITAFFWLPFLEQYITEEFSFRYYSPVYENIVPLIGLIIDFPTEKIFYAWLPPCIGTCYFVVIYIFFRYNKHLIKKDKFLTTVFILGTITIIFSCSKLLWGIDIFYKLFSIVQFPWRFYIYATTFITIGTAIFLNYYRNTKLTKIIIIYITTIFMVNMFLLNYKMNTNSIFYTDQIANGEYLPNNFNIETVNNYKNDNIIYNRDNELTYIDIIKNEEKIELPLIYYKGYKICDDKRCYESYKTSTGLLGVSITNDTKKLTVSYSGTAIYKSSKYITLIGIIMYILFIIKCKNQEIIRFKYEKNK